MRRMNNNNSVETVNAAATAIVSAESRVQPTTVQKRRWGSCWSGFRCFGSQRHGKRIGHAVLVPEPTLQGTVPSATENPNHQPVVVPFVAPPSSPASFLQSEPPSSTQSPAGFLSLSALSANAYSPGPNSIFAIGPYANETQLVSPPVFSTFTTEPSTAPVTPPPDTTPSSPEVPFAHVRPSSMNSNCRNSEPNQKFSLSHYEFQSYHLYPGSPVGQLISPSSVISNSGTCSPFLDREFTPGGHPFLEFRTGEPPKLWTIDGFSTYRCRQQQGSGTQTPDATGSTRDNFLLENHISEVASLANSDNASQHDEPMIGHRVSFELTAQESPICVDKETVGLVELVSESLPDKTVTVDTTNERDGLSGEVEGTCESKIEESSCRTPKTTSEKGSEQELQHQQQPSLTTIGSVREFKFDNADGGTSDKSTVGSDWWANEKVVARETGPHDNWTFFPMMQPGIS